MRGAPVPLALLVAALGAPAAGGTAARRPPADAPTPQVQVGVLVERDTVAVGRPFVVAVRVRAPLGATVEFPAGPDSTRTVQALDPPAVGSGGDSSAVDRVARYRVAAWDVGEQPIVLEPVRVTTDGTTREYRIAAREVFVQSVLPADTAQHVPKEARAPFEFPGPWWLPWLLGLLAATIVGLLLWWWWRRRRRTPVPVRLADPDAEAAARFARVDALRLVEAGERGRHVALMLEVVRDFLAQRYPAASPALTSRELLAAMAGERTLPLDRLAGLLHEGDLVKFARRPVPEERARAFGEESRALVRAVQELSRPQPEPAAAAADARRDTAGVG